MTQPLNQCPCCGKEFESLSRLMTHLKSQHTEAEILDSEKKPAGKKEFATVA